jgi:hypothetical protein
MKGDKSKPPNIFAAANTFEVPGEWQGKVTYAWFWDHVIAHGVPLWCVGCPCLQLLFPEMCAWGCMKTGVRRQAPRPFNHELISDDGVRQERWFCCSCQKWATKECMDDYKHAVIPIEIGPTQMEGYPRQVKKQ